MPLLSVKSNSQVLQASLSLVNGCCRVSLEEFKIDGAENSRTRSTLATVLFLGEITFYFIIIIIFFL